MAFFKRNVSNTVEQQSGMEEVNTPKNSSLLDGAKAYFHDKLLQWKAFGANQVDNSEIVQFFKKAQGASETEELVTDRAEVIDFHTQATEIQRRKEAEELRKQEAERQRMEEAENLRLSTKNRLVHKVFSIPKIGSQVIQMDITVDELEAAIQGYTPQMLTYDILEMQLSQEELTHKYLQDAPSLIDETQRAIQDWRDFGDIPQDSSEDLDRNKWNLMHYIAERRKAKGISFTPETNALIASEVKRASNIDFTLKKKAS